MRRQGFQVAVAVADRLGVTQALLRDRFVGANTPLVAANKAWTAVSFRTSTSELAKAKMAGQPVSGLRQGWDHRAARRSGALTSARPLLGRASHPAMNNAGSTIARFSITDQCRCGPVARPVAPTAA
jgi:hypothetical protein